MVCRIIFVHGGQFKCCCQQQSKAERQLEAVTKCDQPARLAGLPWPSVSFELRNLSSFSAKSLLDNAAEVPWPPGLLVVVVPGRRAHLPLLLGRRRHLRPPRHPREQRGHAVRLQRGEQGARRGHHVHLPGRPQARRRHPAAGPGAEAERRMAAHRSNASRRRVHRNAKVKKKSGIVGGKYVSCYGTHIP